MKEVDLVALAGLLHDIGKFRQRCGLDISDGELATFCPSHKTYHSHIHAAHTARAIEEMGLDRIDKRLIQLAASHHLHSLNEDASIIQQADRLASSLDRKPKDSQYGQKEFIKSGIETPFSFVYLSQKPQKHYYPLQKLQGELKITSERMCNDEKSYKELYNEFIKEIKNASLRFQSMNDFLKLKSILERYTTFIPSSTYKSYPDVSLFDHSLATAAIAVAIKRGDGQNFSLIQGDFTSIQNYIFSKAGSSNRYMAKILRAKSLFVNIATELIALKTIQQLGLSPYNIVMNAGGKFMILAHQLTKEDRENLTNLKKWVNDEFKKLNYLQTKFIIKSIDFTKDCFKFGEFHKVYKQLANSFEAEKLRFEPETNVFEDYIAKAKNGICAICGIVPVKNSGDEICKYCEKFKEIGEKLPKAKYINFDLDDLLSIEVSNQKAKEISFGLFEHPIKRVANVVPTFSKEDINNPRYEKIEDKFEAIEPGAIKSFYHIAADGLKIEQDKLVGRSYLAILKADIDNLGKIFICGFKEEAAFSRYLYLSRMLDYFFTDILMDFIKDKNVYTVFAGGDDLFLIGHYEDIIDTYSWIVKTLRDYTRNDDFHLSAAIRLTRPNVPLPLMAEFAEEDLEKAKSLPGKDGVTIFEISMKNNEFSQMLEWRYKLFDSLYEKLQKIDSGTTFMYRFYDFIQMQKELDKDILKNSRWKYMFRYLVEKNFAIKPNDQMANIKKEIKNDLGNIAQLIEQYDEKLILPLNLFLYSIRK